MPRVADSTFSEVHLSAQEEAEPREAGPDTPFRILIMGDFSGRTWRDNPSKVFMPRLVDRDNFDDILADMHVGLDLHGIRLSIRELDDFHPDRLYNLPVFEDLDQYLKPAASAAAAAAPPRPPSSGSLLDDMVDEQDPAREAPVSLSDANDLASFIQRVTKGHLEAKPDAAKQQQTAKKHGMAADLMRGILHHPRTQAIEAAWRALSMLIRGLDTDGDLKVFILDITLPELVGEMAALQKELKRSGPWALLAGNFAFGQTEVDAEVLKRMGALGQSLQAPFIAEAKIPGDGDPPAAWTALRKSPHARWIGLALPRFLLRLPYGKSTSPVEGFPFEEMPESEHGAYLWGSPAFFCAYLLGQTFIARGWDMKPIQRRIDGLPMHVYREDGEPAAKPCAEVLMTEKEANQLMDAGFMPLASIKHEPAAMIVRFQSIAEPLAGLAGIS